MSNLSLYRFLTYIYNYDSLLFIIINLQKDEHVDIGREYGKNEGDGRADGACNADNAAAVTIRQRTGERTNHQVESHQTWSNPRHSPFRLAWCG